MNPGFSSDYLRRIHMLPTTPLTPELVKGDRKMTAEEVAYKTGTALHEAAHLVAACACPGSSITSVRVHPTGRRHPSYRGPNPSAAGTVKSLERYEDEILFITLAGYHWEANFGDLGRAEDDLHRGDKAGYEYIHEQADDFVVANRELIHRVAAGVLTLARKDGTLAGNKLNALVAWVRARVDKYQSKDAKPLLKNPTSYSRF